MSLLVVGSIAFDSIETPAGRVDRTLGGAATYVAVSASLFTDVRMVGVVGDDFTDKELRVFAGRKINTDGIERASGKSFFWAGRYNINMNQRTTLATELNVFANFRPRLPAHYADSEFLFLANIDPALQLSVLKQMRRRPRLVALDTMNFWIEGALKELKNTLRHVDVLVINDDEARQLSGEHNLTRAARRIFQMGPKTLVIKRGEHGALMVHPKVMFSVPAFPLDDVRDPTGAGDTFAGGFMGYLAREGRVNLHTLRRAMVYGSVMGSFAVERFGLDRLRTVKIGEVKTRARHFAKLTQFDL